MLATFFTLSPVIAGGDESSELGTHRITVPEPGAYRLDSYRAPTPATVRGGNTISTAEVQLLIADGHVVVVDVLPQQKRPENLPASTLWIPKPRYAIPGSVWLPDVGRGALSLELDRYFYDNLQRLTEGNRQRAVVIYCLSDCWMSWNAAKRAIGYGYTNVYWYPDGTDGWIAAGLPTAKLEPVAMPGDEPS